MNYKKVIARYVSNKYRDGKYSLFSTDISQKYVLSKAEDLYFNVIKEWDQKCNLPIELGEYLNKCSRDKNNIIAFSRVYIGELNNQGIVQSNEIVDIANNGLKNNGHINSSGAVQSINSPSDVLTPLIGIEGWINLVGSYKGNNATVLYSIPSKFITNDCHFTNTEYAKDLYNLKNNIIHIKPEYLIGIIIKNNGYPDIFLSKEQMLEMNNQKNK